MLTLGRVGSGRVQKYWPVSNSAWAPTATTTTTGYLNAGLGLLALQVVVSTAGWSGARLDRRNAARWPQRAYSSTALGGSSSEHTPSRRVMLTCFSRHMTDVWRRYASLCDTHTHTCIKRLTENAGHDFNGREIDGPSVQAWNWRTWKWRT